MVLGAHSSGCRPSQLSPLGPRDGRLLQHLIHEAVGPGALGIEVEVAVEVLLDLIDGLAGAAGDDVADDLVVAQDLAGRDLDVAGLTAGPRRGPWCMCTVALGRA